MILKILYFILMLAVFRLVVRLVRAVITASGSRPEVHSKPPPSSDLGKEKIIDVEFTEEAPPDPNRNNMQ